MPAQGNALDAAPHRGPEPRRGGPCQPRATPWMPRRTRAYPTQRQEALLDGLACGFEFFGGVFKRTWFDNPKTIGQEILEGRTRREQRQFAAFRSHYLFEAVFCTPGEGHEKGRVARQAGTIQQAWQEGQDQLRPLSEHRFGCCVTAELTLDGYGMITFDTNRYSVPVDRARKTLTVRAYPFTLEILDTRAAEIIAHHPRSYAKGEEVIDPVHFLPLLEQRAGAFEHSRAMRQLRRALPPVFDDLLARLRRDEGLGVREFVRTLRLLEQHPRLALEEAVSIALRLNTVNRDAIELILRTRNQPAWPPISRPKMLRMWASTTAC